MVRLDTTIDATSNEKMIRLMAVNKMKYKKNLIELLINNAYEKDEERLELIFGEIKGE